MLSNRTRIMSIPPEPDSLEMIPPMTEELRRTMLNQMQSVYDQIESEVGMSLLLTERRFLHQAIMSPAEVVSSETPIAPMSLAPTLTLDTLRSIRRRLSRVSGDEIVLAKKIVHGYGLDPRKRISAHSGRGRSSAYVFAEHSGEKLGLNMFTMKDCDEKITWDSEAMAKRPRYA